MYTTCLLVLALLYSECMDLIALTPLSYILIILINFTIYIDLKLHSHAVLIKSCNLAPGSVLGFIEEMLPHMKATLDKKMKESAVPSDVERALELKRSTLRVVQKLTSLENIDSSSAFKEFKEKIATDEFLSNMMNELRSGEKV